MKKPLGRTRKDGFLLNNHKKMNKAEEFEQTQLYPNPHLMDRYEFAEAYHQSEVKPKNELIKELEDYIEFLGKHVSNHEAFMSNRGGYTPNKKAIQEGKEYRKRIKLLKK